MIIVNIKLSKKAKYMLKKLRFLFFFITLLSSQYNTASTLTLFNRLQLKDIVKEAINEASQRPRFFSREKFVNWLKQHGYDLSMTSLFTSLTYFISNFFIKKIRLSIILKKCENEFSEFKQQFEILNTNESLTVGQMKIIDCVLERDNGIIFSGKTGTGKSTIAKYL